MIVSPLILITHLKNPIFVNAGVYLIENFVDPIPFESWVSAIVVPAIDTEQCAKSIHLNSEGFLLYKSLHVAERKEEDIVEQYMLDDHIVPLGELHLQQSEQPHRSDLLGKGLVGEGCLEVLDEVGVEKDGDASQGHEELDG